MKILRLIICRQKEVVMVLFLLGLMIGGVLGIALAAILSSGANADEKMEQMMKKPVNFLTDRRNVIIHKN